MRDQVAEQLSGKEAASLVGRSADTLRRWKRQGLLKHCQKRGDTPSSRVTYNKAEVCRVAAEMAERTGTHPVHRAAAHAHPDSSNTAEGRDSAVRARTSDALAMHGHIAALEGQVSDLREQVGYLREALEREQRRTEETRREAERSRQELADKERRIEALEKELNGGLSGYLISRAKKRLAF